MQVTTTYRFQRIAWTGVRRGKCTLCGKYRKRQRTFEQTASPFNKHKSGPKQGQVRTAIEIQDEVRAQAKGWEQEPHVCATCEGA